MRQQNAAQPRDSRNPYNPNQNAQNQQRQQNGGLPNNSPLGSPFVAEIGTLQVGPDGVGRVQNRLEGITVRNLAGMSVIVESTDWQGSRGMQNDPRVSQQGQQSAAGQAGLQQGQSGQLPAGQLQGQNPQTQGQNQLQRQNQQQQGRAGLPEGQNGQQAVGANGQMTRGAQGIVASGVIQLRNGGGMTEAMQQQSPQTGVQNGQQSPGDRRSPQSGGIQRPAVQQPPAQGTPR
jgi:hypothetical protein